MAQSLNVGGTNIANKVANVYLYHDKEVGVVDVDEVKQVVVLLFC